MSHRVVRAIYWISTLSFVVPQTWNAFLMLIEAPRMAATITGLGYPLYFMKILGCAQLLGALAILALGPGSVMKEWAYAGFTFMLISACASHIESGEIVLVASVPLMFLVAVLGSYVSWKRLSDAPHAASGSATPSIPSVPIGRWPYSSRTSVRLRGHA